MSAAWSH